ncbi:guanylate kinase [Olsenella sp. YH-ols2221]|uniref:guanylate kinase n=1 Tax=Olsenella kribbiana TaxID=3115221 RepID=UPI002A887031|nr:guanylate kinase [Olsenella sp.]MDY3970921.1 guanylate kinase [Atopobiaceae bacterium]MDD5844788.1 guanylate kinase [Olsenella sp.]MDD6705942.1 guanylate kinase [Olsenella sp.]MDY4651102.1 guanylate kinase [Atopobiaceae bacterium]
MGATPRLFVISGPSGAGKGTLLAELRKQRPDLGLTVSATTRSPRPGEVDGTSYYFLSDEEFRRRIAAGEFVEWAEVHGHLYGTLVSEVKRLLAKGHSLVLEIDVQGALNVRKVYPDAVLVFIEPPSLQVLEERLRGRGTEDEASIELRLKNARHEMELADQYDVRIVNDTVDRAAQELGSVMRRFEMDGGSH